MSRRTKTFLMAIAFASIAPIACGGDDGGMPPPTGTPVTVYTRNLYLGSDLSLLAVIPSPAAVPTTAARMWANVQASDYPSRAKVLAQEITTLGPDLVALQEVTLYRKQTPSDYQPGDATPNATEVTLDFLAVLMTEIDARGGGYRLIGQVENGDAELPVDDGAAGLFDLRVTDRDVMLAKEGVETSDYAATLFTDRFMLNVGGTGGVPISFARSFSHTRAVVGGQAFTFATSHLEVELVSTIQKLQAQQMVDGLAAVADPLILIGDFNSTPGFDSYPLITQSFHDAFLDVPHGNDKGPTCCQASDLKNNPSSASQRIDLVLYRGAVTTKSLRVTGTDPATDRTPEGLWASDHFGVTATLNVGQ